MPNVMRWFLVLADTPQVRGREVWRSPSFESAVLRAREESRANYARQIHVAEVRQGQVWSPGQQVLLSFVAGTTETVAEAFKRDQETVVPLAPEGRADDLGEEE